MQGANSEDTEKELLAEVEEEIEKVKYYMYLKGRRRGFCRD